MLSREGLVVGSPKKITERKRIRIEQQVEPPLRFSAACDDAGFPVRGDERRKRPERYVHQGFPPGRNVNIGGGQTRVSASTPLRFFYIVWCSLNFYNNTE